MCERACVCVMLHCACRPVTHDGSWRATLVCFRHVCRAACCACELLVKTWFHQFFPNDVSPHEDRLKVCSPAAIAISATARQRTHVAEHLVTWWKKKAPVAFRGLFEFFNFSERKANLKGALCLQVSGGQWHCKVFLVWFTYSCTKAENWGRTLQLSCGWQTLNAALLTL